MLARTGVVVMAAAWGFIDGYLVSPSWARFLATIAVGGFFIAAGRGEEGWGDGIARAATTLGSQAAWCFLLPSILVRCPDVPFGAEAAMALLRLAGRAAAVDGAGALVVQTGEGSRAVALMGQAAALPALLRIASGLLVLQGGWGAGRALPLIAGWGFLRLLVMAVARAEGMPEPWMREPALLGLTLLPIALFGSRYAVVRARRIGVRIAGPGVALALLAGAGTGFWGFLRPAGAPAGGRVILDESHSGWEPVSGPFGTDRFGQRTLYNYALWKRWIEAHYPVRVIGRTPEDEDLAAADVVVIKTPTRPYEAAAVARYERFVRRGGGLLMIGDHTNLFGMTTVLNPLAAPFGALFRADATFPLDHTATDTFEPGPLRHPLLRGIRRYPFETSCSLALSWRAVPFMIGRRLGAEQADYGHVNFFGNIELDPGEPFGLFAQGVAIDHGRGRVALFSDSTNFSNFSMLWPGRRRLTLNLIDWLNRRPTPAKGFLGLALILPVGAGWIGAIRTLRSGGAWSRAWVVWSGLAGIVAGGSLATAAGASLAGEVRPRAPIRRAVFDAALSRLDLAADSPVFNLRAPSWRAFNSLYIDTSRTGLWPELMQHPAEAGDAVLWVIVNPGPEVTAVHRSALERFLARGGRLLVIDSILNGDSGAATLLEPFGLSPGIDLMPDATGEVVPCLVARASDAWRERIHPAGLRSYARSLGAGRIVYALDAALLSDRGFGGVYATPDADQVERHRAQMDLMATVMSE